MQFHVCKTVSEEKELNELRNVYLQMSDLGLDSPSKAK